MAEMDEILAQARDENLEGIPRYWDDRMRLWPMPTSGVMMEWRQGGYTVKFSRRPTEYPFRGILGGSGNLGGGG